MTIDEVVQEIEDTLPGWEWLLRSRGINEGPGHFANIIDPRAKMGFSFWVPGGPMPQAPKGSFPVIHEEAVTALHIAFTQAKESVGIKT